MERVRAELEADSEWTLFVQGEGSKAALVERFRETGRSVLLGTTSFWHGVDVAGEALSLVVIDKLPFDVPSDPLVAARIRRIRESGGNPFATYQTPAAVLELKQGLGRLIRSRSDRGILCVLDPRIRTKAYGRVFLRSLPPYPVVRERPACERFFRGQAAG
jgi:ATP-dependent DNA helicase DinG